MSDPRSWPLTASLSRFWCFYCFGVSLIVSIVSIVLKLVMIFLSFSAHLSKEQFTPLNRNKKFKQLRVNTHTSKSFILFYSFQSRSCHSYKDERDVYVHKRQFCCLASNTHSSHSEIILQTTVVCPDLLVPEDLDISLLVLLRPLHRAMVKSEQSSRSLYE